MHISERIHEWMMHEWKTLSPNAQHRAGWPSRSVHIPERMHGKKTCCANTLTVPRNLSKKAVSRARSKTSEFHGLGKSSKAVSPSRDTKDRIQSGISKADLHGLSCERPKMRDEIRHLEGQPVHGLSCTPHRHEIGLGNCMLVRLNMRMTL